MVARSTATRDRHRKAIARGRPPCWICGQPIDYAARYPEPESFVVDHKTPLNRGGTDTLDNKAASHQRCNRAKSDRLDGGPVMKRSGSLAL